MTSNLIDRRAMTQAQLAGQVALITGGSRGIGAAVARLYSANGAAVSIAHEPNEEMKKLADLLAEEINLSGGKAIAISGDLADPRCPEDLVTQTHRAFGDISIIVANAAASSATKWNEITTSEWDLIQNVNVRSTWLLVKAAYEDLRKTHGSIITVTSVMVQTGQAGKLHYSTSKSAIIGMTRVLARELGADGIRVNSVMPGAIQTEQELEETPDQARVANDILPKQSLKRRGVSSDLAGTFLFLASTDSSFITGQVINVDGGWVMY